MSQFDIIKNKNTKSDVEFLIKLQSDSISLLNTRIVAPLRKANNFSDKVISKIHIQLTIKDENYIAYISEMAAVPSKFLGEYVENISQLKTDIVSAIDLIFTGF